ncbi:MAG: hypothetical protein DSY42_08630 [Aquifex sp.]|nr:MAG: hypothetical protein DSY42_08630 [Aquifex sp.]
MKFNLRGNESVKEKKVWQIAKVISDGDGDYGEVLLMKETSTDVTEEEILAETEEYSDEYSMNT